MTDPVAELDDDDRFESAGDAFAPIDADWDATVSVEEDACRVEVEVPTLDAVVEGETVADVVEDGWFETFELRIADAEGVTYADTAEPTVERLGGTVTVETAFEPRPGSVADDALALVNFVEGTWFQGVIPGYDYAETVQSMRERARQEGQEGTPL